MIPFELAADKNLLWIQTELLKPCYELRSGDHAVASLSWLKEWGTLAEATLHSQHFTFKRSGFWKPFVTVRQGNTQYDFARVELHWLHNSQLVLTDGTSYAWSLTSMWRQEWAFSAADQTAVVKFRTRITAKGLQADVNIAQSLKHHKDIPLLVTLGWYLIAAYAVSDGGGEIAALIGAMS